MTQEEERLLRSIMVRELKQHNMTQNEYEFVTRMQNEHPDRYWELLKEVEAEISEERKMRDFLQK